MVVAALAAIALGLPAESAAGLKERPVTPTIACSFSPEDGVMSIVIRETRYRLFPRGLRGLPAAIRRQLRRTVVEPTNATIERRGDAITVFSEDSDDLFFRGSGPAPCKGGDPTVTNTDRIEVRNGKRTESSNLTFDQTYGSFGPGLTDEGDGSSEIEVDVAIAGQTSVRLSRGADSVQAAPVGARTAVNLNATETTGDNDLLIGRRGDIVIDGAGAGDSLTTSRPSLSDDLPSLLVLAGGQGSDSLSGSSGTDALFPGSGADVVSAGRGGDVLLLSGRAADSVDCGPGTDFVIVSGPGDHELRRCESVDEVLFEPGVNNGEDVLRVPPAVERTVRRLRHLRRG